MDRETILKNLDHAKSLVRFFQGLLEEGGEISPPAIERKKSIGDVIELLKKLMREPKWPPAVAANKVINPHSDIKKMARGAGIIDNLIDVSISGASLLDFGCGEGHATFHAAGDADLAIGYDPHPQGWSRYPERDNLEFTNDIEKVKEKSPYDIIVVYDVIEHAEGKPVEMLEAIGKLLAPSGKCYIRFHPWTSRHGDHGHLTLNKAFSHLVFSRDFLQSEGSIADYRHRVLEDPLETYRGWIKQAGLKQIVELPRHETIEPFFDNIPKLAEILQPYRKFMDISFVDYTVGKS